MHTHTVNQSVLRLKLQQKGYTNITTANNGLQALKRIQTSNRVFDFILMVLWFRRQFSLQLLLLSFFRGCFRLTYA